MFTPSVDRESDNAQHNEGSNGCDCNKNSKPNRELKMRHEPFDEKDI